MEINMRLMKKVLILAALFLIAGTAIFFIADQGGNDGGREIDVYFLSKDSSVISAEKRRIDAENINDFCKKALEELIKGPSEKTHIPIMDKGVKIAGFKNDGGRVSVDFSEEYKKSGLLAAYAVVKTLCQIPDITAVCVTCGGKDATGSGFISGDEINLASDDDCATGLDLYFADSEKTKLVHEYRRVNITDKLPVEQYIVSELIKGPRNKNSERLLSPDTGILSVETTDGTCYVNFKQDFIGKNSAQESMGRLIIYSIVNSLTERDDVSNVQFLVDGKKTESFSGMRFDGLFYRNDTLIEK